MTLLQKEEIEHIISKMAECNIETEICSLSRESFIILNDTSSILKVQRTDSEGRRIWNQASVSYANLLWRELTGESKEIIVFQ